MNEHSEEEVGSVQVKVTQKSVHKAVRNILKNEMNLDVVEAKNEIRNQAFALIKEKVIEYLQSKGYDGLGLENWARQAIAARQNDVNRILKEAVKQVVEDKIREECVEVVEGIIKNGLEIKIGWNRNVKINVKK